MTPNTAELVAIYRHIKTSPDAWDQRTWASRSECGTSHCFAGWAVSRSVGTDRLDWGEADGGVAEAWYVLDLDGEPIESIQEYARSVLRLTKGQAATLFSPYNTLAEIRRTIEGITGVDPEQVSP